jgi:nucleoside-diphosphate-sugar epimerase
VFRCEYLVVSDFFKVLTCSELTQLQNPKKKQAANSFFFFFNSQNSPFFSHLILIKSKNTVYNKAKAKQASSELKMNIDTSSPVVLTGSTGYVAGVICRELLKAGLTVHCPVRDPTNESKIQYLKDIEAKSDGTLKFFKADLLEDGSYLESMKGCSVVFHTASPFVTTIPKGKEKEVLLDPAVNGTKNILQSAKETLTVKRVVLTSSCYAIATDGTDTSAAFQKTGKLCNEDTWNETASIDYNPYAYSKALAEKAAWEFVKDKDCNYDLVVINPSFVMGPGVKVHPGSESYGFVQTLGNGVMKQGCPNIGLWVVDVRDVAKAQLAAGFTKSAKGRYIISGTNTGG